MDIVGYSDPWSVQPGEEIRFYVSTNQVNFNASLVRLIHGNTDPAGPGFKQQAIPSVIDGSYPGIRQGFSQGSHVAIHEPPRVSPTESFTLQAWIYPTAPGRHPETVVASWNEDAQTGFGLFLDEEGTASLWLGATNKVFRLRNADPVEAFRWYFLAAAFSAETNEALLVRRTADRWGTRDRVAETLPPQFTWTEDGGSLGIGACIGGSHRTHYFNGLIDSPRIFSSALGIDAIDALERGEAPEAVDSNLVAAWDFGQNLASRDILDVSGNGHHGLAVNLPRRAVPGWNWSGRDVSYKLAEGEYGAIFLHEEDLEDADWDETIRFQVPDDLPSGVYALHLRTAGAEDHVPFFVRPRTGNPSADIAFLVPTYSYLAYANDHATWRNPAVPPPPGTVENLCPEDRYSLGHRLKGLYDRFEDGSGCCFSSRKRPVVNMRPRYRLAVTTVPHQLGADLHLIDWLEGKGFAYDVITDEDVNAEGADLLSQYKTVLTGHHPEYTTEAMLEALEAYTDYGGRLMYLGGNGFYWVISTEAGHPHVIEIRRGQRGTSTWRGREGEGWHQTSGEPGGLWRDRGRAPQRLVGVGMAAQGTGPGRPYRRLAASSDPRVEFIFEGIEADELIGDFGLLLGGAGGIEVDRFDYSLGTPPHALLVATTETFDDEYQHVVEEVESSDSKQGGSVNPQVRGDMTFFETSGGGAVFSVGSMNWVGSLSYADYDNNVSRITENVLRRFTKDEPLLRP